MLVALDHNESCELQILSGKNLANVTCTAADCGEQVSCTDTFVKYGWVEVGIQSHIHVKPNFELSLGCDKK